MYTNSVEQFNGGHHQRSISTFKMSSSPFKVLRLNELLMDRLHIYSHPLLTTASIPTNDFFRSITTYYILFHVVGFIAGSAVFAYQNASHVVLALRTGTVLVGTCQALGMFLTVGCKFDKVKVLHQKLQAIVDQTAEGIYFDLKISDATKEMRFNLNFLFFFICLNFQMGTKI